MIDYISPTAISFIFILNNVCLHPMAFKSQYVNSNFPYRTNNIVRYDIKNSDVKNSKEIGGDFFSGILFRASEIFGSFNSVSSIATNRNSIDDKNKIIVRSKSDMLKRITKEYEVVFWATGSSAICHFIAYYLSKLFITW